MNLIPLTGPPLDASEYVETMRFGSFDTDEASLFELLNTGTPKIAAPDFALATIMRLENPIAKGGYKVQFIKISGFESFADFYLTKS